MTAHDSPDAYMEFVGSLKDPGEVSCGVNYDPEQHDALVDDFDAEAVNYQVTFPTGTTWQFPAILTGYEPDAPYDGKLAANLTWKISGKPTITPAA